MEDSSSVEVRSTPSLATVETVEVTIGDSDASATKKAKKKKKEKHKNKDKERERGDRESSSSSATIPPVQLLGLAPSAGQADPFSAKDVSKEASKVSPLGRRLRRFVLLHRCHHRRSGASTRTNTRTRTRTRTRSTGTTATDPSSATRPRRRPRRPSTATTRSRRSRPNCRSSSRSPKVLLFCSFLSVLELRLA